MSHLVRDLIDWIEIPSVTGEEGDYGDALARALIDKGFAVETQEVAPGRRNILARAGRPEVVFCTHLDTVPPYFGSSEDSDFVYGRGSCDAKGQAACMLHAGADLLARGEDRVGYLFTIGEEIDSKGAAFADASLDDPAMRDCWAPRYTIVGEPTDNTFVAGHKGIFKLRLIARGVAGHSSQDVGPSAVHELVGCCHRLLESDWGTHPILGHGTLNVGEIHGGLAPNVVAPEAEAEILIRAVEEPPAVRARIEAATGPHVRLVEEREQYGPVEFLVPEGESGIAVAFGTDAPHLRRWGRPLLFGAGSILDAHTAGEKVAKRDLDACTARHAATVLELLTRVDAGSGSS